MAITTEQIFAAADDLDAAGQNPTLAAVRKAVGGGSFTTIQAAMTEWKARKAAREAPARHPVPDAVRARAVVFIDDLWTAAVEMAEARLASDREAITAERANMEAARREAAELADQLTAELDETRARLSATEVERTAARRDAEALRQKLAVAETRAEDLTRQAETGRADVLEARRDAAEARERAATLSGKLDALNDANAALMARLGTVVDRAPPGPPPAIP
jgi:septal ring factor EnvC (AmiA/AmiB activator)